jgi:signal transduction histidine kinase/CheY-like chemotaxis protein
MTAEHDLDRLLRRIAESAWEFSGAGYGALAAFHADGRVRAFFAAGITTEERERIGRPPEGRGLLGHVFRQRQTLRLDDLTTHPAAVGFPPGHPPMRTFLAVPIHLRDETLGAIYLTEKTGGFTAEDEALLTTLGADVAVAIENARLMATLRHALDDLGATQDQLVQSEARRAVGGVASGMAHHLNNVLAVIRGRLQLLLEKVAEPSIRRTLETVDRAAANGADLIRRVQEFSRVQPVSEPVPTDLNQLAREALELTGLARPDEAQPHAVPIEARLDPGQIPPVVGDPTALREVLVNLLLNAVEALPAGGQIRVGTRALGGRVDCSVTDTGVGMSEEVRRRALEPFFTTRGPRRGGLGLSVSQGIVQRHGGALAIESRPGVGTTVTVSLPVAPAGPGASAAPGASRAPGPSLRILVIDEEPDVRAMLAEILAGAGHLVTQAASGADGVSSFEADRHDLVVTCARMPGLTGWQVAEAVKALSPVTPVILITEWDADVGRPPGAGWCVDDVISKPFDPAVVASVIARTAAGGSR